MPDRQLGRRHPKNAPALRAGSFLLKGAVPTAPQAMDNFTEVSDWGLYGNDRFGDCGPTSVANQRKLVTRYLGGGEQSPSQDDVFDLYRRSGNPQFDPATDADDNGVDMQTMLEAVHAGGIAGTRCLGFAKVDVTDLAEVHAAIATFGSLLLGVNLEQAQQAQTDQEEWDYQESPEWGGHAVLSGQYGAQRNGAITWAKIVEMTDDFWRHQVEEAWVVIWPEHLGTVEFLTGVDVTALAAAYRELTGRDFPAPLPVPPVPPSPPADADELFAGVLRHWVTERHVAENHRVAVAAKAWLAGKGL